MFNFEKLHVYQKALEFVTTTFSYTNKFPQRYKFTISSQFERAALSIHLNIAEGSGRTKKDFSHFISLSRGSCYECIPLITIAHKLNLLDTGEKDLLYNEVIILSKMLTSLKKSMAES